MEDEKKILNENAANPDKALDDEKLEDVAGGLTVGPSVSVKCENCGSWGYKQSFCQNCGKWL